MDVVERSLSIESQMRLPFISTTYVLKYYLICAKKFFVRVFHIFSRTLFLEPLSPFNRRLLNRLGGLHEKH